jgi:hypothetical protein
MKKRYLFMFVATVLTTSASAFAQDLPMAEVVIPTTDDSAQATPPAQAAPVATETTPTPYVMDDEQRKYLAPQPVPATVVVVAPAPRPYAPHHRRWRLGPSLDVGVPSGITLGIVFNPWVDWVRLGAGLSDNVLHTGGRFSLQLDPMALMPRLPIGLFGDFQAGGFSKGSIPGHSADLPTVGYTYESLMAGLRLGRPGAGFKFVLEAGTTHLNVSSGNFASVVNNNGGGSSGLTIGDPKVSGWASPAFDLGMILTF